MLKGFRVAKKNEGKVPLIEYDYDIPRIFSLHLLYKFLRKQFGKPRSPSWDERIKKGIFGDDSDKFQWDYFIRTPNGFLSFYDRDRMYIYWRSFMVAKSKKEADDAYEKKSRIPGKNRPPPELQADIDLFFQEYRKYEKSVVTGGKYPLTGKAHQGIIILNPFEIHYSNFKYHKRMTNRRLRTLINASYLDKKYASFELEQLFSSSFILLMASFDGFINLLYECFLLDQIRQQDVLREKIGRETLVFKIEMLPIYCYAFKQTPKLNQVLREKLKQEISELRKLLEIRNKLVHANLFKFRYTNMIEEDSFLFYSDFVAKDDLFGVSTREITERWTELLDHADKTVLGLVRDLIMTMEVDQRKQFRRVYREYWIGYVTLGKNRIKFVKEEIR
jgi:hypothetical protein